MLHRLEISNYALIENVSLDLSDGFTVITGETGAGKSIILAALNLLLGERADTSVIKQNEKKCFLEAEFNVSRLDLKAFFEENDLDFEENCLVRREFNTSGKSRCFINDSPVQVATLKQLGQKLISIHSQHKTLELFESNFQMEVLDYFAGNEKAVEEYRGLYSSYKSKVDEKIQLQIKEKEARKEKDYLEFLLNELEAANLDDQKLDDLQSKHEKIENAEAISQSLEYIRSVFENDNIGPYVAIKTLIDTFEDLKKYGSDFGKISDRLRSLKIELEDIESEASEMSGSLELSGEEIQTIKDKLEMINSLLFKHNLTELSQLIDLRNSISDQLQGIESVESDLKKIEAEIKALEEDLIKRAEAIRLERSKNIPSLELDIRNRLSELAMEEADLKIDLTTNDRLGPNGMDTVKFLFKTNKGGSHAELKKTASGGELSRLMMSLLAILGKSRSLPTLIFDEIDTGVSGEVAAKMAKAFQEMGADLQLISITHLPQVAGKGQQHLHVSKSVQGDKTITSVESLESEDRVQQLAKMISGESVTDAAKENARTLLAS